MAGVAQDEAITATNPLLFFAYQRDGRLFDVFSLSRSVYTVPVAGAPVQVVANGALNLADAPAGTRISKGVYHANFSAAGLTPGTHEVRWTFVVDAGGPTLEHRQRFEVLDKNNFYSGRTYVGYANTTDLLKETIFAAKTASELQRHIDTASRQIEQWTGRWFEPRFQIQKVDGKNSRGLLMQAPIIGINRCQIESGTVEDIVALGDVDVNGLRVYARHLSGMLDPDDRDNPRIEIERFEGIIFQSFEYFPKSPQGTWITGVFGYTDPDGSPTGVTPKNLTSAIGHMVIPQITDPFGQDPQTVNPFAVQSARTRDQAIVYSGGFSKSGGQSGRGGWGGLTGDDFLDRILIPYVRPIHIAAT